MGIKEQTTISLTKLTARGIPLILLLALSSFAANSINIDALFFEKSIREVALVVSILSAPFLNASIFGKQNYNDNSLHHRFWVFSAIIAIILILFQKAYLGIILGNALLIYALRYYISSGSLGRKTAMYFAEAMTFFGCATLFNSIFLVNQIEFLIATTFIFLLFGYLCFVKNLAPKKNVSLKPSYSKEGLLIFLLSVITLTLNNIDLFIVNKLVYTDEVIGVKLLYAKRLTIIVDLIVLTFIQSSTFRELSLLRKKIYTYSIFVTSGILIFYPLFFSLMNQNVNYDFSISLFFLISSIKSITILNERKIVELGNLSYYLFANITIAFLSIVIVGVFKDTTTLLITLLLTLFGQIIIRFFPYRKHEANVL